LKWKPPANANGDQPSFFDADADADGS
jgi:hypothetical protein